MSLNINRGMFITFVITGSGSTQDRSPHITLSPKEITQSAIGAAKAGTAIVHCHVRGSESGAPSRELKYYEEVTSRIRDSNTDVILHLTAGMVGDLVLGDPSRPLPFLDRADLI